MISDNVQDDQDEADAQPEEQKKSWRRASPVEVEEEKERTEGEGLKVRGGEEIGRW